MSWIIFLLLVLLFLPIYLESWVIYLAYTYGVLEAFPQLVSISQPQVFLICLFIYMILKFLFNIKYSESSTIGFITSVR